MTESEFDAFMEISTLDQVQGQIQAGYLQPENAEEILERQLQQILPQGFETPNHYFFTLEDAELETKVGGLWYWVQESDGEKQIFVIDIQVFAEYRRRGYGTQAFRVMEEMAQTMGINTISLNVFKNNHPARAMYEKIGFTGVGEKMLKVIRSDPGVVTT
jgi:RimJ/RimL family protein N-acetyltransferase